MKNKMDLYVLLGLFTVISVILALPATPLRQSFNGVVRKYVDKGASRMGFELRPDLDLNNAVVLAIYDARALPVLNNSSKLMNRKVSGINVSHASQPLASADFTVSYRQKAEEIGAAIGASPMSESGVSGASRQSETSSTTVISAISLQKVQTSTGRNDSTVTSQNKTKNPSTADKNTSIVRQRTNPLGTLPVSGNEYYILLFLIPVIIRKIRIQRLSAL